MHSASLDKMTTFCGAYLSPYKDVPLTILDVGSAIVDPGHASYRKIFQSEKWQYVGADVAAGFNVDMVLPDPYDWAAIGDDSFDVVISGQAFEHIEYVWLSILEIARVLRTNGLVALIAPGAGPVHRYPTDCWRYYPDGFPALVRYAGLTVVESHLQRRYAYPDSDSILWCDAMVVAQKPWRTPAEQADWARRIRAAQQMIKPGFDPAILGTLQDVAKEHPVSRLAPARSLDAIRRREEERLAMLPRFKTKATVATRHLRAAVRAFRQSLNENVAIL